MRHTATKWANDVGKNGADRLSQCSIVTNVEILKNAIFLKHNKAKHNKMKCTCVQNKMRNWIFPPFSIKIRLNFLTSLMIHFSLLLLSNTTKKLWPPHAKSWLIGKDSDAGTDWGQEEKGTTENEMAGLHHRLDAGRPGVLRFMGLQSQTRLSDWTELNWLKLGLLRWSFCNVYKYWIYYVVQLKRIYINYTL